MDIGNAVCIDFPAVIKSHIEKGRRTVWVEASNQEPDSEGDVILQSALLGSAEYFLDQGHIDIDHISEIGARLSPPVRDPSAFIIGKPISVEDAGGGRTAVVWELGKGAKAEEFWSSLLSGEGLPWRASIYGFPLDGGITECQSSYCAMGATRYLVKAIQWKSLAMTQHPVNDAIRGAAKVVSAKAFIKSLSKAAHAQSNLPDTLMYSDEMSADPSQQGIPPTGELNSLGESLPMLAMSEQPGGVCGREALWKEYMDHIAKGDCPHCLSGVNVASLRQHFQRCDGMPFGKADILALALIHLLQRAR